MKIAIHHRQGSFSDRWIEYCKEKGIEYKLVNAYDSDIVENIRDCNAFMWHHHHANVKDQLFAKQLIYSLETAGIKCYPNSYTVWHFDDKVGQKYLLESINAPIVPSYVFYSKQDAITWLNQTDYPKVFKLRGGAGSKNVMLAHSKRDAIQLVKKAFGRGFAQQSIGNIISENLRKLREGKVSLFYMIKDILAYYFKHDTYHKKYGVEKGYAYFQDFIPNNQYDTRMIVINGDKAFGEKRFVRKNDFRASGSGKFSYDDIDENIVKIAFDVSKRLNLQTVAFDFIYDDSNNPMIIEMSYGFGTKGASNCPGYWTDDMQWHEGVGFDFRGWIVENLIEQDA